MIKRFLSHTIPENEWQIWRIPALLMVSFFISSGFFFLVYFGPSINNLHGTAYTPTYETALVRMDIGDKVFNVPANYTRNRRSRHGLITDYAELHAVLPNFNGYSRQHAASFARLDEASPLVIISLPMAGVSRRRNFAQNYAPHIVIAPPHRYGPALAENRTDANNGLQVHNFRYNSPYAGKQIFLPLTPLQPRGETDSASAQVMFICENISDDERDSDCESRFFLGTSARVSYLFKRHHLHDWRAIDQGVKVLMQSFLATGATTP